MSSLEQRINEEAMTRESNIETMPLPNPAKSAIKLNTWHRFSCGDDDVLGVLDDPRAEKPFCIYLTNHTHEQAAAIAYGILAHLRAEGPTDAETENAFDEVMTYLNLRSVKGQIPF